MSYSEINALITLIEDPDEDIFGQVKKKLSSYGVEIIPHLEHCWEVHDYGQLFNERIEDLIQAIQFDSLHKRLEDWVASDDQDLLEGAIIVNKYQYPALDEHELRDTISRMRQEVWLELSNNLTAFEITRVINHMLFDHFGFEGNRNQYHSPQNSFLSDVLTTKKGNPLTLSVIYQILCTSLDLPVHGVNLPNHFLLCYLDSDSVGMDDDNEDSQFGDILFYINPFSKGELMMRQEIDEYLKNLELTPKVQYYRPCGNLAIIHRMINNLIYGYEKLGKDYKIEELKKLRAVVK